MTVNQFAQNLVWASPAAATGAPAMRALVAADIPSTLGATTFSGQITADGSFVVSLADNPALTWEASGNATNQKNTQLLDTGAGIEFLLNNDTFSASNPALALTRSGYTPTSLTWYGSEFLITNTTNPNITLTAGSTDAYIAKITSAGAYFSDAVANDLAIRSNEGTIRMGVSGGTTSALQMTNTALNFNGPITGTAMFASFSEVTGNVGPYFQWYNTGAGTNEKYSRWIADTFGDLLVQTVDDAYTTATTIVKITRSGDVYSYASLGTNPTTFANIPSSSAYEGARVMITDCPTNPVGNFAATITAGGGSYVCPLWYDGSHWRVG